MGAPTGFNTCGSRGRRRLIASTAACFRASRTRTDCPRKLRRGKRELQPGRPRRRFGGNVVVAAFVRPFDMHNMPIWLPALPFAIVALSLFCLGILAWLLGRDR